VHSLEVEEFVHSVQKGFEVQSIQTPDPSTAALSPPTLTFEGGAQPTQETAPSALV
jgi:microcystin-dependent protein